MTASTELKALSRLLYFVTKTEQRVTLLGDYALFLIVLLVLCVV